MAIRKKETAVSNCRLSVKVAIACSSAFAQDINPVIGMTRFLFSIFDRMTIRKTRDGSFKLSSLCKGGDYLLFRFRSTIGVMRFNFSVRDGKRWNPHAVFTLISLVLALYFPSLSSARGRLSGLMALWGKRVHTGVADFLPVFQDGNCQV